MADVIHLNYLLLPIIGRFGINLGFGNQTIKEVCDKYDIHLSFFLEILNSYHNHEYYTVGQFQNYPIELIVDYLRNTHKYYVNSKIPELEEMVEKFIKFSSNDNKHNNTLIANFFNEYKHELLRHLNSEEKNIFPYTIELVKALSTGKIHNELLIKINSKNINQNDDDHNQLEEKLYDLKNLIIKFLPPVKHKDILENLLIELFQLENDLIDHSRIEDKVLIPKVKLLEQKILALGVTN